MTRDRAAFIVVGVVLAAVIISLAYYVAGMSDGRRSTLNALHREVAQRIHACEYVAGLTKLAVVDCSQLKDFKNWEPGDEN